MAFDQAPGSQPQPDSDTETLDRKDCVGRAGGKETTATPEKDRKRDLIDADQPHRKVADCTVEVSRRQSEKTFFSSDSTSLSRRTEHPSLTRNTIS